MAHEFSRTELLVGTGGLKKIEDSTVAVLGVGGVGSHCIEALARGGIGRLLLVDHDVVSLTNINRQSIAYHSTIGRYKTHVMRERILDINPAACVLTSEAFVLPENLPGILDSAAPLTYIVDAIDTVTAKLALAEYARDRQIPLISSMGTGNKLHGEMFEIADIYSTSVCPLCRVMRRELKKRGIERLKVLYSREEPRKPLAGCTEAAGRRSVPGSVSFVPPVAGLMIAGEVLRCILGDG